ncbi:MAG: glucosaminidase domain-containing protein [Muribaculaceae bacterium]|nr:glucosaminidase domain-containing protein [Muribaculaceae bacterium]
MRFLTRTIFILLAIASLASEADARTRIARRHIQRRTTVVYADSPHLPPLKAPVFPDTIAVKVLPKDEPTVPADTIVPERVIIQDMKEVAILGEPVVDADRMFEFVKQYNSEFTREIAEAYYNIGMRYGIRGDIALCQAILETGWFKFADGTAVKPEQHNYCGLGVTKGGMKGATFDTVELGVTAQIQHLYAYACKFDLPDGEKLIDPRFKLVSRGVAPTWDGLNCRWAANDKYSERILKLFNQMSNF